MPYHAPSSTVHATHPPLVKHFLSSFFLAFQAPTPRLTRCHLHHPTPQAEAAALLPKVAALLRQELDATQASPAPQQTQVCTWVNSFPFRGAQIRGLVIITAAHNGWLADAH